MFYFSEMSWPSFNTSFNFVWGNKKKKSKSRQALEEWLIAIPTQHDNCPTKCPITSGACMCVCVCVYYVHIVLHVGGRAQAEDTNQTPIIRCMFWLADG